MTPEDEEFNRVEMESRIKQDYVRDMKQPSREQLMAEVTVLTELVRVLSDRVAELEKQEPVVWNLKDVTDAYKLGAKSQQRTWVGLTDEDDIDWEEGGNLKDLVKAIESKLEEKNT